MQDSEEHGAFDGEIEVTLGQQLLKHLLAASLLPKPFEDERGANALGRNGWHLAILVSGEQQHMLGEASTEASKPSSWPDC